MRVYTPFLGTEMGPLPLDLPVPTLRQGGPVCQQRQGGAEEKQWSCEEAQASHGLWGEHRVITEERDTAGTRGCVLWLVEVGSKLVNLMSLL